MAKSTTPNVLAVDIEKIKRFTETELAKISENSELPFCYQIGVDTVVVGRNKVVRIDDKCWRVIHQNQQLFDFFSRKDAIFYCIALHKNDHKLAKSIQSSDQQLNQLEFEAMLYRRRFKQALAQQDHWKSELYSNKYSEVMAKIAVIKKELQKSIDLAKYIKVAN